MPAAAAEPPAATTVERRAASRSRSLEAPKPPRGEGGALPGFSSASCRLPWERRGAFAFRPRPSSVESPVVGKSRFSRLSSASLLGGPRLFPGLLPAAAPPRADALEAPRSGSSSPSSPVLGDPGALSRPPEDLRVSQPEIFVCPKATA